jgi:hypothetical protein
VAFVPAFLRYVPARFGVVDSSADLSDTERN